MRQVPALVSAWLLGVVVTASTADAPRFDLRAIERGRILPAAERFLKERPLTVTAFRSPRSAGGVHDFFSEGDYWWPDPTNPDGPYIQRDGESNPDNFVEHRRAMIRFATQVATLTSAYRLTGDERFAAHAMDHLRAWFVDDATRMLPHLLYAQAIKGRATGRGTGIIDTIHLVEVARSVRFLAASKSASRADVKAITAWFQAYLTWLTTHEYGRAERDATNNHGTCWVMQAAAFAQLTGNAGTMEFCRDRYRRVLVPDQMASDGSFPLELKRTKPYGYSLFNLDAFATICQILSPGGARPGVTGGVAWNDLWAWTTPDGRGMRQAMQFLFPYIRDKSTWPFAKDVMYFDKWPVRHPSLLFAGLAYSEPQYLDLWLSLEAEPTTEEVIRNLPIRHPLLWVD
jgi:hypothetical protein